MEDQFMMDQIPDKVQQRILTSFLYRDFIKRYEYFFSMSKIKAQGLVGVKIAVNTKDEKYRDFIVQILKFLEPYRLETGEVIFRQDERVDQAIFLMEGCF